MLGLNQEAEGLDFDPVAARGAISVRVGTLRDRPSGGLKMGLLLTDAYPSSGLSFGPRSSNPIEDN